MVAEILFRGILHDTVEYSPLTPGGYTESGVSLGKKTLGLDDIEGVVVANRIADLYDNEPMKDGQTRMIVDGKDYVIDMDTDASAIGLNHHAYVQNGKVLGSSLEAEGNVIGEPEHGEAAKVADLAKGAGIKTNADTDYYVNFDEVVSDTSNYRLEYLIGLEMTEAQALALVARNGGSAWIDSTVDHKFDRDTEQGFYFDKDGNLRGTNGIDEDGTTPKDFLYDKVIPAKETISSTDSRYMKEIFVWSDSKGGDTTSDDLFFGEVYVGTKSKLEEDDISDDISHDEFIEKYINVNENRTISSSDNGEWLRVIDNNGDGVAEYVLRTDFVMTTVTDYEKRTDTYVVEWEGDLPNGNGKGTIKADAIRPVNGGEAADMSIGSVILYTLIDGYYYISNPVAQSMTIDKKSIDSKKGTFTVDGEGYTWSGIEEAAERYYDSLANLAYETKYDMYPDHFGFIRLATETTRNFVLLTDGWFYTDNRNDEYKADLYNGETFVEGVEVVDKARKDENWNGDGFIDTYEDDHKGNRGTWLRLNTFGEYYWRSHVDDVNAPTEGWQHYTDKDDIKYTNGVYSYTDSKGIDWNLYRDPFITNIALGSEADGKWTLEDVTDPDVQFNGLYRDYHAYELAGTNNAYYDSVKQRTVKAKTTDLWGVTDWTDDAHVVADTTAIQANGSTLYYLVQNPGAKDQSVISWVGYQNVPESVGNFVAERAYAVTRDVRTASVDYEIAEVVVFEGIYSKAVKNPQLITRGNTTRSEYALGKDDEGAYIEHYTTFKLFGNSQLKALTNYDNDGICAPQIRFYDPAEEKYIDQLDDATYADYGIYAGTAKVLTDTKGNDYIQMIWDNTLTQTSKRFTFYMEQVEAYELNQLTGSGRDGYANKNLEVNETYNIRQDDQLIIVVDGDDNVKMVVNVSGSGKDGNTLRHDGSEAAIGKLVELYGEIVHEEQNPAAAEVTVTFVNSADGSLVETWKRDADKNGQLFLLASDLALGGNTVVSVKNEAGTAIAKTTETGGVGYLLTGISKDTTVTVTLTVNTNSKVNLSLSGFSLSGADLQSAVKNNALTNYTAGTDLTSLTYGDAYKFVLKNLNNTQYKYELTPDTAEAELSWNAAGTELTITGTINAAATALILTRSANDSTDIKIGTRTGADVTILTKDNTGAAPAKNADATVLRGQAVTFKVELTTPATSKIDTVTYTVQGGSAETITAADGVYTISQNVVDMGLPITIDVAVLSTAPVDVTITDDATGTYMSVDGNTYEPAANTTVDPSVGTLWLRAAQDIPTPTATVGTVTADPVGQSKIFKVTGINANSTITINAAAGIGAGSLTGEGVDSSDGSITDPSGNTGTLKYALVNDDPTDDIAAITELNNTETNVNTVLGVTLGAKPTLAAADAGKFLVIADVDSNNVVGIVAVEVQLDAPTNNVLSVSIAADDGMVTLTGTTTAANVFYAIVAAADISDVEAAIADWNILTTKADIAGDVGTLTSNDTTAISNQTSANNNKMIVVVELNGTDNDSTVVTYVTHTITGVTA